jgi:hypothetical protein
MAKKNENFSNIIDKIISTRDTEVKERKLVDIITFCEGPAFLNFMGQDPPLQLWPMQKIVLKLFYRGTPGNENLELTPAEVALINEIDANEELDYEDDVGFKHLLEKYYDRSMIYTHLLLVMGRRSSKTMMVSIIAAYEAYKLCECPGGNPQKFYNIGADKPIHIINVAVSEAQALDPLFAEIETRLARAPYFADKINNEASIKGKIYLLTDADKIENERRRENNVNVFLPGSIVLMSGHSNSGSLRGHATKVVLFDEFAHFLTSSGKSSGDEVYNALTPSMKQFGKEGKVVMLSDPRGRDGMFYRLFQMSQEKLANGVWKHPDLLAIQLPTWRMNPMKELCKEVLEKDERPKDPVAFLSSWGARFLGAEGARLFDSQKIDACVDFLAREAVRGDPQFTYYIHLDPATTSHNYALVMVHTCMYGDGKGTYKRKVFVDYVKFWRPVDGEAVNIREVETAIVDLCRRFRVHSVTFDAWQSTATIQALRARGINAFETQFRPNYITEIYGELKNLINQGDLVLYLNEQLIGELKNLNFKYLNRGIKRFFDPKGDYRSDDVVDALAGAVYQSLHTVIMKSLPRSSIVYTGRR